MMMMMMLAEVSGWKILWRLKLMEICMQWLVHIKEERVKQVKKRNLTLKQRWNESFFVLSWRISQKLNFSLRIFRLVCAEEQWRNDSSPTQHTRNDLLLSSVVLSFGSDYWTDRVWFGLASERSHRRWKWTNSSPSLRKLKDFIPYSM